MVLDKPPCLHIPALYGDTPARVFWGYVEDASYYELDCVYDKSFDEAEHGIAWDNLDESDKKWNETEDTITWKEFEQLRSQGITWSNIDIEGLSWAEIENKNCSWKDFNKLPERFVIYAGAGLDIDMPEFGLKFSDTDTKDISWQTIEDENISWKAFERLSPTGIWSCLDSKFLIWNQIDDRITWNEFENLSGFRMHKGCEISVPSDKQYAIMRIRACSDDGTYSSYLTADKAYISHYDIITLTKDLNESFYVQLIGDNVQSFEETEFTLTYDPDELRIDVFSPLPAEPHYAFTAKPHVISSTNGTIRFKCLKEIAPRTLWSGLVSNIKFNAIRQGNVQIRLETDDRNKIKII